MPVENQTNRAETHYSINRSTMHITGLVQTPVAGPKGTPSRIIRTHAPVEVEVVTWTATSEGGPPVIPSPYHPTFTGGLNANRLLLNSQLGHIVQCPIGGGNPGHIFTISGVFTYAAVTAGPIVRDYYSGKYPFESSESKETNYHPSSSFSTDILDQRVETVELVSPIVDPARGG